MAKSKKIRQNQRNQKHRDKKKKTKNSESAAINETERQGFVEGSVLETNAEGSTKEEELSSVLERQHRYIWEHVGDKSEVERKFELNIGEMDLKINDSFEPSADSMMRTCKLAKIEDSIEGFSSFKTNIKKGASNISFKNAEGAVSGVKKVCEEMKNGMLLSFEESEWETNAEEGSRKEAENKKNSEKASAMEKQNRCISEKVIAFDRSSLEEVKHVTLSFEDKIEVEKNFELKTDEMELKINDSFKPSADDLEKNAEEKDQQQKNEGLGEDLEKDMSELEKSSEAKINDDSKPFVDDPEKSEDLVKDFSQFETKIKERRSELAFEEKEKILPCNLLETLVPASENRCIEEKDGAFTENFTEEVKQENVNQSISLFEDIERHKIETIDFLKPFLDDMKIKTLARIEDLDEKFVQLEKKQIEMLNNFESKIQYICNAVLVPLQSEQQTFRQMLNSHEAKIRNLERKVLMDIINRIANATKELENKFELKIGKVNSQTNDRSNSLVRELESIRLSLKNRDVKIENEQLEMEKNFELKAAKLDLKVYEELEPFVDEMEIMKMEMKEKEKNIEELKKALEILQFSFVESQKSRGRVWKFIVPTIKTIFAAAAAGSFVYYAARNGKSSFRRHY